MVYMSTVFTLHQCLLVFSFQNRWRGNVQFSIRRTHGSPQRVMVSQGALRLTGWLRNTRYAFMLARYALIKSVVYIYNFGRSRAFENISLRELKRASCNGGNKSNNSFTDVSIIRPSHYVTLKIIEFFNFVAEGYRRKLNHCENFLIYGIHARTT